MPKYLTSNLRDWTKRDTEHGALMDDDITGGRTSPSAGFGFGWSPVQCIAEQCPKPAEESPKTAQLRVERLTNIDGMEVNC